MATAYMGGKVDVSLNGVTIPAQYLSDEGATTTITEGTREVPTMAGTFSQPSGTIDEAMVVFNVTLPNMFYLKNIFPDQFEASSDRPTVAGRTTFGSNTCVIRENTPVVVHYTCDPNSDNDVYIPNGAVQASVELTQNASDPVTVAVTVYAQPGEGEDHDGAVAYLGTGDLSEPTIWDAETEAYVPVTS